MDEGNRKYQIAMSRLIETGYGYQSRLGAITTDCVDFDVWPAVCGVVHKMTLSDVRRVSPPAVCPQYCIDEDLADG